ncbi:MAG: hypothetical protein M3145_01265 [Pseudomonadota bacterium]|nr:hypothetical protein [Pseudomonadota bacterium]
MKIMLLSMVVAIALGVAAAFVLNGNQRSAFEAFSTSGTRVGDPGHNLVGPKWTGNADKNG